MRLISRLINDGFFVFWKDENDSDSYNVKVFVFNGDDKIEILSENILNTKHYFSIDKIGSGTYEIEITSYKDNQIVDSINKNISLISSPQLLVEIKGSIEKYENNIEDWKESVEDIYNNM